MGSIGVLACVLFAGQERMRAQDSDAEALVYFTAGQHAQGEGNYATAVQEFKRVIALLPQAAEAYSSLGLALNAENKFDESARALEQAEKLKRGLPGVSLYLGIDRMKLHQAAAAIPCLKEATRLEPSNTEAWIWLGSAWDETGREAEAIDALREAQRISPRDPVVLFRLGDAYRRAADTGISRILMQAAGQPLVHQIYGDIYTDEGLWEKATGHYRRALIESAAWRGAHLGLGEVALRQGKVGDAELEFQNELKIDPGSTGAFVGLAKAALYSNKPIEAVELLDRATRADGAEALFALGILVPSRGPDPEAREQELDQLRTCLPELSKTKPGQARTLALAFVNWRLGNTDASVEYIHEFQKTMPRARASDSYQAAVQFLHLGDPDSALAAFRTVLKVNPHDLQAAYMLARTYRYLSMSVLRQLLIVAPDSYPAHQLLAETLENAEDYERAIAEYRVVEGRAPNLPGIHFALGHLLLKTGARDEALAEFQQELQLDPDHAGANAEVGAIFVEREEPDTGITYLRKAVSLAPDLWSAHRELGQAYYMEKRFTGAEAELQKAVDQDPDGVAHYELGMVYRALGRFEEARKMFARSRQIKQDRLADANAPRAIPEFERP